MEPGRPPGRKAASVVGAQRCAAVGTADRLVGSNDASSVSALGARLISSARHVSTPRPSIFTGVGHAPAVIVVGIPLDRPADDHLALGAEERRSDGCRTIVDEECCASQARDLGTRRFARLHERAGAFVHGGRRLRCRINKGSAQPDAENEANGAGQQVTANSSSFADRAGRACLSRLALAGRPQNLRGRRQARTARIFSKIKRSTWLLPTTPTTTIIACLHRAS